MSFAPPPCPYRWRVGVHGVNAWCVAIGSGCIAALEAEKFLAEADAAVANPLETENEATKSESNGGAPEYRSNPLL